MIEPTYDIQELVNASGVPRRTIYFYVQQGILPPPQGAGLAAHYGDDHLLRLRLLPILRQQGLRLDDIRARFAQMNVDEMQRLIEDGPAVKPPSPAAPRLKNEARLPTYPDVPLGWGERSYRHYNLPGGITLSAPVDLPADDRQRLQMLLQAARQIFAGGGFVYQDVNQPRPPLDAASGSSASQLPEEE